MSGESEYQEHTAPDQPNPSEGSKKVAPGHRFRNYQHPTEEQHRTTEEFSWRDTKYLSIAAVVLTAVATGFTFAIWYLTKEQVSIAKHALDDARLNSAQQLRAYVGVESVKAASPSPIWPAVQLILSIKNFGQTPALNATIRADITLKKRLVDADYVVDPKAASRELTSIAIGPQQIFSFPFDRRLEPAEEAEFAILSNVRRDNPVWSNQYAFVIYGTIIYNLVGSKLKVPTQFCTEFVFGDIQGRPCKRHNEAS